MKKGSVVVLILAVVALISSCSTYTCATYAKEPQKKAPKEAKI